MKRIKLSSIALNRHAKNYVLHAFKTNELSTYGENLSAFESSLENYLGKELNIKVACLSSGTAAIHLALIQLGVSPGDEVLCQTFTFCGSANPIVYQGAIPVFVDSEKETWNMCPIHLENAINDRIKKGKKPKAIILVHLYGMPAKLDELLAVAKKYEIPVIEDAAEALGASYKGRKCGTFGDFGILSFNGNKIITTSGGGALICKSEADKEKIIYYATQARDNAPHYQHSEIGFNYRMSNISAGIGRGQMEVLDKHVSLRQEMNRFYKDLFADFEEISLQTEPGEDYKSNFWLSAILVEDSPKITKEKISEAYEKANIETRPLWKPMHLQPVFKNSPYYGHGESEQLFDKGICLPSGSNLNNSDRNRIREAFTSLL